MILTRVATEGCGTMVLMLTPRCDHAQNSNELIRIMRMIVLVVRFRIQYCGFISDVMMTMLTPQVAYTKITQAVVLLREFIMMGARSIRAGHWIGNCVQGDWPRPRETHPATTTGSRLQSTHHILTHFTALGVRSCRNHRNHHPVTLDHYPIWTPPLRASAR